MHIWRQRGIECSIYSSGSVFAQKLLFAHIKDNASEDPKATIDRTDLITQWFDTSNAGPKTQAESYRSIATKLGKPAQKILFLSDNVKEIKAALQAGMKAVVVDRPGNAELSQDDRKVYEVVTSFDQIQVAQ